MSKIGIYKYENKLNGKIYIGQSNNIEKRYNQHSYDSSHSERIHSVIDRAIAKYGLENFSFEIIEECPVEKLDEREIYWIAYYDSYNNGYNSTIGGKSLRGENHPRALLTEEEVWQIREAYRMKIPFREAYEMFQNSNITERGFKKIWDAVNWTNVHMDVYTDENKAWHKTATGHGEDQVGLSSLDRAVKQPEIDAMVEDYRNGMNLHQIAKKYDRDYGVVQKYINNPIEVKKVQYRGKAVKNLNTGLVFKSISQAAKWAGCGATTLTRHLNTDQIAGIVPETGEPAEWIEAL